MSAVEILDSKDLNKVKLFIDDVEIEAEKGATILEAARLCGIDIPTLCHNPELEPKGLCRVCVVEVEGSYLLQPACAYPVSEGMRVKTNTPTVREARRTIVELLLARGEHYCPTCPRNRKCDLQALAERMGIREIRFDTPKKRGEKDISTPSIVRDPDRCILCRRCVMVCDEVQGVGILSPVRRGFEAEIVPGIEDPLSETPCSMCGQCIHACPVGAIYEKDDTQKVWEALSDPSKHVIVQTAPAVRVAIGEELDMEAGSINTGKLVSALRKIGFDRVFDTNFTADLTIIEEGNELLSRLNGNGALPMITSCSPGWIKYLEHHYPELIPHLSTCKSPQQMFGALAKTYYAEKSGIPAESIFVVSIMPCTAKKFEAQREEMNSSGYRDVDVVLTTRELGRMIRESGLDLDSLPEEEYDDPFGISTGAGVIFGATGGVMEAALRTVYEVVTGEDMPSLEFLPVRGLAGIKEARVSVGDTEIAVAVAHGLRNAGILMEMISKGEANYHFIEVMACPGGCIGGGGQPIPTNLETRMKRMKSIYNIDRSLPLRKSHENPAVKKLYEDFLGEPLSEMSHKLLHTHYKKRGYYDAT